MAVDMECGERESRNRGGDVKGSVLQAPPGSIRPNVGQQTEQSPGRKAYWVHGSNGSKAKSSLCLNIWDLWIFGYWDNLCFL